MSETMVRTNVYLLPRQREELHREAQRSGISDAEFIRRSIDTALQSSKKPRKKPSIGYATSDKPPIAHRVNEALAEEGFGE